MQKPPIIQTPSGPKVPLEAQVAAVVVVFVLLTILGIGVTRPTAQTQPGTVQSVEQPSQGSIDAENNRRVRLKEMETWMRDMLIRAIHEEFPEAIVELEPMKIEDGPNLRMEPYHCYTIHGTVKIGGDEHQMQGGWNVTDSNSNKVLWGWDFDDGFDPRCCMEGDLPAPSFYVR